MSDRKTKLVLTAMELALLGDELEAARKELRELVEQGTPYETDEMKNAVLKCQSLELRWKALEGAYLESRRSILQKRNL